MHLSQNFEMLTSCIFLSCDSQPTEYCLFNADVCEHTVASFTASIPQSGVCPL